MVASHIPNAELVTFDDIPGWATDDLSEALQAFSRHRQKPDNEIYKRAPSGCDPDRLLDLAAKAAAVDPDQARHFFEEEFVPVRINKTPSDPTESHRSIVTGFFEPEYRASRTRTNRFVTPVYAKPSQLIDAKTVPKGSIPAGYRFAWRHDDGSLGEAPDRAAIEQGALNNRSNVLAWLESPIDAFFMHIQGAARLKFADGTHIRLSYAAKTGHPFTAIGRLLADRGAIEREKVSMQTITAWLRDHPDQCQTVMNQNRSFIFFKETPLGDRNLGPFAAAKIQLTAQRSLAVDMQFHTFATPIFVHALNVNEGSFSKLMVAQETGTAITGPSRGDIFFGTGSGAGEMAGGVVSPVTFFVLCPKSNYDAYLSKWLGP